LKRRFHFSFIVIVLQNNYWSEGHYWVCRLDWQKFLDSQIHCYHCLHCNASGLSHLVFWIAVNMMWLCTGQRE
jgi:hypothetical protein